LNSLSLSLSPSPPLPLSPLAFSLSRFNDNHDINILEIFEQPEAVARALNYGGRIFGDDNVKLGGMRYYIKKQ
jgi:hypothetical protein